MIRSLGDALEARLQSQAVAHGRTLEDEARAILEEAVQARAKPGLLADRIRARFQPLGGVELPFEAREPVRDPPDFA